MADELGYPEERIRIPILVTLKNVDATEFIARLKNSSFHTKKDVSLALDSNRVIIFKTMPDEVDELFLDYKYIIGEYLQSIFPMRELLL